MKALLENKIMFRPPPLGCVLALPGLPGSGSKIYDRSPYGNSGAVNGATWTCLPSGLWHLQFDGSDDYAEIPGITGAIATEQLSVGAWIRMDRLNAGEQDIISCQDGSGGWSYYNTLDDLYFTVRIGGGMETVQITGAAVVGTWYHVICVYDGINLRSYRNGQAVQTLYSPGTVGGGATGLKLGRFGASGLYSQCALALPCLYRRSLSALEIQNLFQWEKELLGVW